MNQEVIAQSEGVKTDFYEVDGLRLRVRTYPGKGTPILLCNGLGANLEVLEPLVKALSHPVILFDTPGSGESATPVLPYRVRRIARMLARLLDKLEVPKVHIAGLSWGASLAQEFARRSPSRVDRMVLIAAGAVNLPRKIGGAFALMSRERFMSSDKMLTAAPKLYGGMVRKKPELLKYIASKVKAPDKRGYYYQLLSGLGWTSAHWLHRISVRTLVLVGDDDPMVSGINSRILAALIPHADLHWIKGGGHLFALARANETAAVMERFLTDPSMASMAVE